MDAKGKYSLKISSLLTPENIEIVNDIVGIEKIVFKLLENLALNYGIGNIHSLFKNSFKNNGINKKPIAIGEGCCLFHFRIQTSDEPRIAIALTPQGLSSFEMINSEKIRLVVAVASARDKPDIYLKIVKSFRDFFSNKTEIDTVSAFKNGVDVLNYLDKNLPELPEVVYAGDVMDEVKVSLCENNNLRDAIDKITKTGNLNIPVVDLEGNLIGEVASSELMEVCLPRYILWMNDITPIVNFEPFQNLLGSEDNTWLAEIMNYDCATVQVDDPLMKAALVMTKKGTDQTYVLNDKKLVGIISLHYFIEKIMRE